MVTIMVIFIGIYNLQRFTLLHQTHVLQKQSMEKIQNRQSCLEGTGITY